MAGDSNPVRARGRQVHRAFVILGFYVWGGGRGARIAEPDSWKPADTLQSTYNIQELVECRVMVGEVIVTTRIVQQASIITGHCPPVAISRDEVPRTFPVAPFRSAVSYVSQRTSSVACR